MANRYTLNKTGEEVDAILDGVVPVEFNVSGTINDYCNSIKIGDKIYALVGIPSPASTDKIYKHNFKFMYGNVTLEGTMLINRSSAYSTPFALFSDIQNSIKTQILGAEIITVNEPTSTSIKGFYVNTNYAIASLNVTTAMTFTNYTINPY